MTDALRLAQVRVLQSMIVVFFWTGSPIVQTNLQTLAYLCLKYGNPPMAPIIYASYGMRICRPDNDIGVRFTKMAAALADKWNATAQKPTTLFLYATLLHWKE